MDVWLKWGAILAFWTVLIGLCVVEMVKRPPARENLRIARGHVRSVRTKREYWYRWVSIGLAEHLMSFDYRGPNVEWVVDRVRPGDEVVIRWTTSWRYGWLWRPIWELERSGMIVISFDDVAAGVGKDRWQYALYALFFGMFAALTVAVALGIVE